MSERRPVEVTLVGVLPTIFNMCAPCCTTDELGRCGIDLSADQLREYPPDVLETNAKAAVLFMQLLEDYRGAVRPVVVDSATPRGIWLTLRHGLGHRLSVLVRGKVVRPELDDIRAALAPLVG